MEAQDGRDRVAHPPGWRYTHCAREVQRQVGWMARYGEMLSLVLQDQWYQEHVADFQDQEQGKVRAIENQPLIGCVAGCVGPMAVLGQSYEKEARYPSEPMDHNRRTVDGVWWTSETRHEEGR